MELCHGRVVTRVEGRENRGEWRRREAEEPKAREGEVTRGPHEWVVGMEKKYEGT
jgi:hypothetical protein